MQQRINFPISKAAACRLGKRNKKAETQERLNKNNRAHLSESQRISRKNNFRKIEDNL